MSSCDIWRSGPGSITWSCPGPSESLDTATGIVQNLLQSFVQSVMEQPVWWSLSYLADGGRHLRKTAMYCLCVWYWVIFRNISKV